MQQHISRNVVAAKPVSQRKLDLEHRRPRWLREMIAEAVGVYFYVFPGIGAVAAFTINKADAGFGSLLQVGFAFALGIVSRSTFTVVNSVLLTWHRLSPSLPVLPSVVVILTLL